MKKENQMKFKIKLTNHVHGNIIQYDKDPYQKSYFINQICKVIEDYQENSLENDLKLIPFFISDGVNLQEENTFMELKSSFNKEDLNDNEIKPFIKTYKRIFANSKPTLTLVTKNNTELEEYIKTIEELDIKIVKEIFQDDKESLSDNYGKRNYEIAEFFYNNQMKITLLSVLIELFEEAKKERVDVKWLFDNIKKQNFSGCLINNMELVKSQLDQSKDLREKVKEYLKQHGISQVADIIFFIDTLKKCSITINEYIKTGRNEYKQIFDLYITLNIQEYASNNDVISVNKEQFIEFIEEVKEGNIKWLNK